MQYFTKSKKGIKTVMNIIQDSIQQISQSAKIAAASSIATAGSVSATWIEWIPEDIGKLAILISLALSSVLLYNHIKKNKRDEAQELRNKAREKRDNERHELEMKLKKRELNDKCD